MKILAINLGYLQNVPSGGDKHVLDVVSEWSRREEVTLLIPDFARPLVHGVPLVRTMSSRIPRSLPAILWVYLCRWFFAMRLMRWLPADIVVCSPGLFDLIPARLHSAIHGSVIGCYVFHLAPRRTGGGLVRRLQNALSALSQRISVRLCRGVHCVFTENQQTVDELCTMGISPDQICRQTPVVHVDAVRRAPSLPAPEILFVGRLVPSKGIFDLLDAIGPLDVTVGYIGNGEERARLEKEVQTRGLGPRVTVYGSLPEDQLYGLLRGCRLFVLPSYEEGYGIAIAEAIAAGKPVLAYELPHYTEVFNGAILSVPPGDVRQLSRAIDEILRGTTDLQPYLARYSKIILMDATSAAQNELVLLKKRMAVKSGGTPSPRQNS